MKKLYVVNLKNAENCLQNFLTFRASNLSAFMLDNNYIVLSHATIIAKFDSMGECTYFDNTFYSVTSSKYQRIIQKAFSLDYNERKIYTIRKAGTR